jgi:processive 1,2-diacylglycerol beta-glucosyltransferase
MAKKRIILMYISQNSGHHHASLAIETALRELSDAVDILNVNSFHFTNPILEQVINRAYMGVVRKTPEVWGYLYDNPKIVRRTQRLRDSIHKYNSQKMKRLIDNFDPHAVMCTQAFPCGIVADHKKTFGSSLVLAGVLTDYAPHAYWFFDNVDFYFIPSEETRQKFIANGIPEDRLKVTGIPIHPKFRRIKERSAIRERLGIPPEAPVVLIMGGSQGMGPFKEIIKIIDSSFPDVYIIAIAGENRRLYAYLHKRAQRPGGKIIALPHVDNIDELMSIASFVVSKPGGITISEALAKGCPLIMVKPIPGHEEMNASHLVKHQAAMKINHIKEMRPLVRELLSDRPTLGKMREKARECAKPESALDIARIILERIT